MTIEPAGQSRWGFRLEDASIAGAVLVNEPPPSAPHAR